MKPVTRGAGNSQQNQRMQDLLKVCNKLIQLSGNKLQVCRVAPPPASDDWLNKTSLNLTNLFSLFMLKLWDLKCSREISDLLQLLMNYWMKGKTESDQDFTAEPPGGSRGVLLQFKGNKVKFSGNVQSRFLPALDL